MDLAVLIKVVPDLDRMRFDPERKTVVREGADLFINPFDQRAVRVALDLRRPGETVSVLSMGPPAAEAALRETLALGADRAILVTDRALAGSDTLVTSLVLAAALRRVGHDLVLAGSWTTDSETGQVGPEVAGLLDVPVLTQVRQLVRNDAGGFVATTDTDEAEATYSLAPPAVLTVGEKIAKIRKPTAEEVERARSKEVARLTAADLGLAPATLGLGGSPTVVATLRNDEPDRAHLVFAEGTPEERVRAAVDSLRTRLSAAAPVETFGAGVAAPGPDRGEAFVLVTDEDGALNEESRPLLAEVRRSLPALWPSAVWVGPAPTDADLDRLAEAGAPRVHVVEAPPGPVGSRDAAVALAAFVADRPQAAAGLFLSTAFGREVAGQLAARSGRGLIGDGVGVRPTDGGVLWEKPSFGGGIIAGITSRTFPSLATVRPGALRPPPPRRGVPRPEVVRRPPLAPDPTGPRRTDRTAADDGGFGPLATAPVVVAVGMGLGGPQHLAELRPALARWGAALGASRRVVDAGWVPRRRQIGLTGRAVAPALGILLGISGAANHLIGWKRARALLAVNSNPAAPVFAHADAGIVGRWEEVLPPLTEAVAALGIPRPPGA